MFCSQSNDDVICSNELETLNQFPFNIDQIKLKSGTSASHLEFLTVLCRCEMFYLFVTLLERQISALSVRRALKFFGVYVFNNRRDSTCVHALLFFKHINIGKLPDELFICLRKKSPNVRYCFVFIKFSSLYGRF